VSGAGRNRPVSGASRNINIFIINNVILLKLNLTKLYKYKGNIKSLVYSLLIVKPLAKVKY